MAKCLIIGGGLAGLSSALFLSKSGHQIEIIESSPKFGGRTYSFIDKETGTEIDNGQHIMMGSYSTTLEYLKIIGSEDVPDYQDNLYVEYLTKGGNSHLLKSSNNIYPINLLIGFLKFSAISFTEKLSVLELLFSVNFKNNINLKSISADEWLNENSQSDNVKESLWNIIGIGALNTNLTEVPAYLFRSLLKKMFFDKNFSSTIILPKAPLNKLFIEPAIKAFSELGIKYTLSEGLDEIEFNGNLITNLITNKRSIEEFDFVILAIPPNSIGKIKSNQELLNQNIINMETSPIVTVHLWEKESILNSKFLALIDSKIHWIFKNHNHISLVISAAENIISLEPNKIIDLVYEELELYFPNFNQENITKYKIIKEKRATLKSTDQNEKLRNSIKTNFSNLIFAGDWTDTGLPGTIEGAILSGKRVSQKIS